MPNTSYGRAGSIFRHLLREFRERAALTQIDVAAALSVPQSYVSKYETGERRLDFPETAAVCAVLGVSIVQFAREFVRRTKMETTR